MAMRIARKSHTSQVTAIGGWEAHENFNNGDRGQCGGRREDLLVGVTGEALGENLADGDAACVCPHRHRPCKTLNNTPPPVFYPLRFYSFV